MDLHLLKDGGSIVGDDDFTIWGNQHLVHTLWTKRCLQEGGNSSSGQDVNLKELINIKTLTLWASRPLTLFFLDCSLKMMKGRPDSSNANDI